MDQMGYQTGPWLFLVILATYIILSLVIGGKKTYFDPFVEPPEEKDAASKPQA